MKNFIKKNKKILLLTFLIVIIFLCGIISFLLLGNSKVKTYEINNDEYSMQYNSTWKVTEEDINHIKLIHKKSNSELNIKIKELEDENQYKSLEEIFDSILYNIQEQNDKYKLIYKEQSKLTKNEIDGYKILLESGNTQTAIYLYKQGTKVIIISYEATNNYFDILLDNVNMIIYNFSISEETFDVITDIDLETNEITYTEQEDIKEMLQEVREEEITSSNYLVNYSIPSNFSATASNTQYGNFRCLDLPLDENIYLGTSILQRNIYEYLDRESSPNIYNNNLNSYNKDSEQLNVLKREQLSYIYKNSYLTNNKITENIKIVFELNKNHIFIVTISSEGVGIPKELVDMIKINNFENVASN